MSGFTAIDLSKLPSPDVIESLNFETILQFIKDDFTERAPEHAGVLDLESDPLVKLMESAAYVVLTLRQRVNDASRAVMLAYAGGADLDNLAALFAVERQVVELGNLDAIPPIPPTYEDDARLRRRVQLSLEGHSTAGPVGSYLFWGLSADPRVKDIDVASPNPGEVLITVLSIEGNGTSDQILLDIVDAALNHEDVRPLTDQVTVQSATVIDYQVQAELTFYAGPDTEIVRQVAQQAVIDYVVEHHVLGHNITLSGLFAALHQPGVQNVIISSPASDIAVQPHQAAHCSSVSVTTGGTDE
ncbi:baseplate assembly protein [Candidatus Vondammii sp. HM_W22]|uniref:baseplate assembly protein n=1 Tax=Candidatus Vondammii sp. HM_W22 TaxID=2687299 RepID=UPI001F13F6FF|nr:baseplate J/gp47 family protein [Candidatus Vondammii sp. HM_W22]